MVRAWFSTFQTGILLFGLHARPALCLSENLFDKQSFAWQFV